jgi:choline dehydrogenase-like flavoprotein
MISDAAGLSVEGERTEVCIVGAGPAGIVLAIELAREGKNVLLLESGGARFETSTHDLNRGEVLDRHGHGPLETYRRRLLGGASTSWGGRCAPFDPIDYETRDFVPHSGWPIGPEEMEPYYRRAGAYLDLGANTFDRREALTDPGRARQMLPGLDDPDLEESSLYLFSPPTNFYCRYGPILAASRRVRVLTHANCCELVTNDEGTEIDHLVAVDANGRRFPVRARQYVLAAGGLEVTRLLLASDRRHPGGIGNGADLLGRFYMCHLTHRMELAGLPEGVVWDYERTREGSYCQRTLAVPAVRQWELGLLNHRARVEHPPIEDPGHKNGVLSAAFLTKWLLRCGPIGRYFSPRMGALSRGVVADATGAAGPRLGAHVLNVAADLGSVARFGRRWLSERLMSELKLPSMVLESTTGTYTLRIDAEQAPNPSSRVTLGDDLDAFGQRRLRVDWRVTDLDVSNLTRTTEVIGRALERSGCARLKPAAPLELKATGGHHIGTTRMAADPSRGVVDPDCRLHGVGNLHVASSSVFPTSSYANPTLMVLALTIRLADRLGRSMLPSTWLHRPAEPAARPALAVGPACTLPGIATAAGPS